MSELASILSEHKVPLQKLSLGGLCLASAVASRFGFPGEVADLLGGHEWRAMLEHLLTAGSVALASSGLDPTHNRSVTYRVCAAYAAVSLLHEGGQSNGGKH